MASLTSASSSVDSVVPNRGSTPAADTNSRRSITSPADRVAIGPTSEPVRGSSRPPVISAVTEGWPPSTANESTLLVSTVSSRTDSRPAARRCTVDEASMPIAPPSPTSAKQLLGDAGLGSRVTTEPIGERLRATRHRSAADPGGHPVVDERVEVATHRHLAHAEFGGEVGHLHEPGRVEFGLDPLQSSDRVDPHRRAA